MRVTVEISPGELFDRISILEIKTERISNRDKVKKAKRELETLNRSRAATLTDSPEALQRFADLKSINEALWDIENRIRECEVAGNFGPEFIALARAVYQTNDRRAVAKQAIDALYASDIGEVKSYT
jgi:hypothetical protein